MNHKLFRILFIILVSLILGFVFCSITTPYNPVRSFGKEHTVELNNSDILIQEFKGENVFGIHLNLLSDYEDNTKAKLKICLSSNSNRSEKYIDLYNLRNKDWQTFELPYTKEEIRKISNNHYKLSLELSNFSDNEKLIVLLNDNPQKINSYPVRINNEIIKDSTLQFSYSFFSYKAFAVFSLFSFILIIIFRNLWNSTKIRTFIKQNCILTLYIFLIFLSIAKYYQIIKDYRNGWVNAPYFANYFDAGFISKGLPGTVLRIFTDQISGHLLMYTFITTTLLAFILVGLVINYVIKNVESKYKKTIGLLLVFYLFFPMNVLGYFIHFGRVDVILLICFLLSLIMIYSQNTLCLYAVSCFSIIAILCHQIYVFTYYPFIFSLLGYSVLKNKKKNWKVFLFNIIVPALFAIKIQFFGVPDISFSELQLLINSHTFMPILENALFCDHYMPISENIYVYGFLDRQLGHNLQYLVLALLYLLPYIIILLKILKNVYGKCCYKNLFILSLVTPIISALPMFISISDWGRILLELFNGSFFTLLLLCILFPNLWLPSIKEEINEIYSKVGIFSLFLLVYPTLLGEVECWRIFPSISKQLVERINNFSIFLFNYF